MIVVFLIPIFDVFVYAYFIKGAGAVTAIARGNVVHTSCIALFKAHIQKTLPPQEIVNFETPDSMTEEQQKHI